MYGRLVGTKVKVVYADDPSSEQVGVAKGELLEWNKELLTLRVHDDKNDKDIYIHASTIKKLLSLEDAP